jgi:iron complex outermembrane receptor protein
VPSFVVANAMLGYQTPHWGVDLNIHNLTNQRYFIAANEAGAYAGEPFSVFLNLHFNH